MAGAVAAACTVTIHVISYRGPSLGQTMGELIPWTQPPTSDRQELQGTSPVPWPLRQQDSEARCTWCPRGAQRAESRDCPLTPVPLPHVSCPARLCASQDPLPRKLLCTQGPVSEPASWATETRGPAQVLLSYSQFSLVGEDRPRTTRPPHFCKTNQNPESPVKPSEFELLAQIKQYDTK